jgi:outer membrane lipoprotein-sorting protein
MLGLAVATGLEMVLASVASADMPALEPAPEGVTAREIAKKSEYTMRGDTNYCDCRMTVESPRLASARVVRFESWADEPGKRSLIRIHEPAKDRGTGFLKQHPNLWMWVPRVERTVRIPPSMMLQSWMGSDFTNDDLVRSSSELDDYDHTLLGIDPGSEASAGRRAYVLEYVPHEDAPVVWGKIVAWIDVERFAPLAQDFYDEDGVRLRAMRFSEHREVEGRFLPHRWLLTPLEKPGHSTLIEVEKMSYDLEIPDSIFTTRNLKRSR